MCSEVTTPLKMPKNCQVENVQLQASRELFYFVIFFTTRPYIVIAFDMDRIALQSRPVNLHDLKDALTYQTIDGNTKSELTPMKGVGLRHWVDHLMRVLDYPKIDIVKIEDDGFETADGVILMDVLEGVKVEAYESCIKSEKCIEQVQSNFCCSQILEIKSEIPKTRTIQQLLSSNFDELTYFQMTPQSGLTLNDILLLNSKSVKLQSSILSMKEWNLVIKHLINGGCPILQSVTIVNSPRRLDIKVLMKGVNYVECYDKSEEVIVDSEAVRVKNLYQIVDEKIDIKLETWKRYNWFTITVY